MLNQETGSLPKNRHDALLVGASQFFTGQPCRRGHISPRNTKKSTCLQCKADSSRAGRSINPDRGRAYRERNAERLARYGAEYRARSADRIKAYRAAYYQNNREEVLQKVKAYRLSNADLIKERREQRADMIRVVGALYRQRRRDQILAASAAWRANNRDRRSATETKRRARKLQAMPAWFSEFDELVMLEAHELAGQRERATGFQWHVDHLIPLQARHACGLHISVNVQVIPACLNVGKRNRMVLTERLEWLHHMR